MSGKSNFHCMDDNKDSEALRTCLTQVMNGVFHEHSPIIHLNVRLSDYSSSFASYIISVCVASNSEYTVFLKNYGSYSRPVERLDDRRTRELHVYRDVLEDARLGTPKYYGSLWDHAAERFWLFLEFVDAKPLRQSGFEYWLDAIRWLGRMNGYSIRNAGFLESCAFLLRHDHDLFQGTAEAAHLAVSRYSRGLAERLALILNEYAHLVEAMVSQSPVLVHGSFTRDHILLDRRSEPPRYCPVDWESAALGSGLFDLAYLVDGYGPPQLDEMIDVYRDEAGKYGIAIPPRDEVVHLVNCYCLHRTMKWLSWAWNEEFPLDEVVGLVGRAEQLARVVL